jgi:hypothetical protein
VHVDEDYQLVFDLQLSSIFLNLMNFAPFSGLVSIFAISCGVNYLDMVDIDETGWCINSSMPRMGHVPLGIVACKAGYSNITGSHMSCVGACDARVGSIEYMLYNRGTTKDKFFFFINELLKKLQGTGRVIMMDNINTNYGVYIYIQY